MRLKIKELFDKNSPWIFSVGIWGAFILVAVLYLILKLNLINGSLVLGLLTAAVIVTIGNAIYILVRNLNGSTE